MSPAGRTVQRISLMVATGVLVGLATGSVCWGAAITCAMWWVEEVLGEAFDVVRAWRKASAGGARE